MSEFGFYHPEHGYRQYIGKRPELDALWVEVPLKPGQHYEWVNGAWVNNPPTEAEQLSAWRATATIPRDTFLQACVSGGIITQEVAEEAADGSWPAAFNTFLSGLTGAQRIQAKARWADAKDVRRNSDILALIAVYQSVTNAQLDAMFGWA